METHEQDWNNCPYLEKTYYEWDTGYAEYECQLTNMMCDIDICPLKFNFEVIKYAEVRSRMISGHGILIDVLAFLVFGYAGAILLLPFGQWIEYKRDCKKHGKEMADEIWRRMR